MNTITRKDIKLIIKAFYHVNAVIRTSYEAHHAFEYATTDEYFDKILKEYIKLKEVEK